VYWSFEAILFIFWLLYLVSDKNESPTGCYLASDLPSEIGAVERTIRGHGL
jgi:hypothetical protein